MRARASKVARLVVFRVKLDDLNSGKRMSASARLYYMVSIPRSELLVYRLCHSYTVYCPDQNLQGHVTMKIGFVKRASNLDPQKSFESNT